LLLRGVLWVGEELAVQAIVQLYVQKQRIHEKQQGTQGLLMPHFRLLTAREVFYQIQPHMRELFRVCRCVVVSRHLPSKALLCESSPTTSVSGQVGKIIILQYSTCLYNTVSLL
jgi:hypothetical protein